MSKSKRDKGSPKSAYTPSGKEVRIRENPSSTDHETPAWQFHRCDEDHTSWGWSKLDAEARLKVIKGLCAFEQMTWTALKSQSGGKAAGRGTNHHLLPINNFTKDAKNRLQLLKLDDIDELFSLRIGNTVRLYGIKDGRVLRFVWHDPHHGSKEGAYPTSK